jgi:hypothetical protein
VLQQLLQCLRPLDAQGAQQPQQLQVARQQLQQQQARWELECVASASIGRKVAVFLEKCQAQHREVCLLVTDCGWDNWGVLASW